MADRPVKHEHVNLAHAREPHQRATMERIVQDGVCPFCREHLGTYHTKPILRETAHWLVTENFAPYSGARCHLLFISATHATAPWELSDAAWTDLRQALAWVRETFELPGGTFLMRWGDTDYTGSSVTHLHAQLVSGAPRAEGREPILTALGYKGSDASGPE
jgi:galactose-1-phosphate uridylyltransferase